MVERPQRQLITEQLTVLKGSDQESGLILDGHLITDEAP